METFDWDEKETVALTIVDTVASVTGREATALEPLSLTVDTDALNTLFSSTGRSDRESGSVRFVYEGCVVEVTADGTVAITDVDD